MQITIEELTEIIDELERTTNGIHSEYCYGDHCHCKFDLIEKYRIRISKAILAKELQQIENIP